MLKNLGLALGMALKFYSSVAEGLKLEVREFWGGANSYVWRSYRGKTNRVSFLNRVKSDIWRRSLTKCYKGF